MWSANSLPATIRQPAGRRGRASASTSAGTGAGSGAARPAGAGGGGRPASRRSCGRLRARDRAVGETAAMERGAVDVVERRHDRAERSQAQVVADRRGEDRLAGRWSPRSRGGPSRRHVVGPPARRVDVGRRAAGRAGRPRRARPRRRPCSSRSDLDGGRAVAEQAGEAGHGALADHPAGREDADPVADRLDLGQQMAGEQDRQTALVDERRGAGRGSRRRRAGRSRSWARRGSGCPGAFTRASAMPRRCFMPREYVSTRSSARSVRPTWSRTSSIAASASVPSRPFSRAV